LDLALARMATSKASSVHLDTVVIELAALEDIAQELMEHVARDLGAQGRQGFVESCDNFIRDGDLKQLVETFVRSLEQVGPVASVADQQARFSILFSLARHLPPEVLKETAPQIGNAVLNLPKKENDAAADKKMRMDVLLNLYTVVDSKSATRYSTLLQMLKFSKESGVFTLYDESSALDVGELCKLLNSGGSTEIVNASMQRELLRNFCDLAALKLELEPPKTASEVRKLELKESRFLLKYLQALEEVPEEQQGASKYARRASILAIKYPLPQDMAQASTLEGLAIEGLKRAAAAVVTAEQSQRVDSATLTATPSVLALYGAVKLLENSPENSNLHQLLNVFAAGNLDDFVKYRGSNKSVITDLGLDADQCEKNMRLLTLASLAATNESVTYDAIAEKLQIERQAVEEWVIDGIISKLIDAKIDQLNQTIVINRGSQRLFSQEQWKDVQIKMRNWTDNVRQLLATVKGVRQEQDLILNQQQQEH